MPLDYLTTECDEVKRLFALFAKSERAMLMAAQHYTPSIQTERYLSGDALCDYLHISPRTLQTLRDRREIPYTVVSGRVFLYPESGIREVLKRNYRPAKEG